jgi:hypothetical protein
MTMLTTPTHAAAPRQPKSSTSSGTMAPARAPPSGTPVCLSENTKSCHLGVVRPERMCALAGLKGP